MVRKILFILIGTLFASMVASAQGAWVPEYQKGFMKLDQRVIIANQLYNPDGDIIPITTAGFFASGFFGEIGLGKKSSITLNLPFLVISTLNEREFLMSGRQEPGDILSSIGDIDIGYKYGLIDNGPFVLSAEIVLGLPTGKVNGGETGLLQTGDGEFNQMIRVAGGYSFHPSPFYAAAGVAFNNRTRDFSDEFHFFGEIGYNTTKWVLILKSYSIRSFFNGDATVAGNSIFANNMEFTTLAPEVLYRVTENLGFVAQSAIAFQGRNILARPSYSLGVFLQL